MIKMQKLFDVFFSSRSTQTLCNHGLNSLKQVATVHKQKHKRRRSARTLGNVMLKVVKALLRVIKTTAPEKSFSHHNN